MKIEFKFTDTYTTMIYDNGKTQTVLYCQTHVSNNMKDNIMSILNKIDINSLKI